MQYYRAVLRTGLIAVGVIHYVLDDLVYVFSQLQAKASGAVVRRELPTGWNRLCFVLCVQLQIETVRVLFLGLLQCIFLDVSMPRTLKSRLHLKYSTCQWLLYSVVCSTQSQAESTRGMLDRRIGTFAFGVYSLHRILFFLHN